MQGQNGARRPSRVYLNQNRGTGHSFELGRDGATKDAGEKENPVPPDGTTLNVIIAT